MEERFALSKEALNTKGMSELVRDFRVGCGDFQSELSLDSRTFMPPKRTKGRWVGYRDAGDVDGLLFVHASVISGAEPCSARTFMAMPPRALKRVSTSHQRG